MPLPLPVRAPAASARLVQRLLGGWRRAAVLAALAALLAGCAADDRQPLVVYSPHGPELLRAFEARFEQRHPGVDVQWLDMGSQEVLDRLRSEKANPQADVWFGAPAETFWAAAEEGLLQPHQPRWAAEVRPYSDPQGRFHAVYLTPEVIAYNRDAVSAAEAPRDWDDVLDPRWKGRVLIRDPLASGTMRTIFGMVIQRSLRATGDTAAGFQWLRRLDAQTKQYVLNPTMLYTMLARQEGVVTLWTMPDIELLRTRTGYPIDYTFPSSGTPLVVDAVALVRGAPNPAAARAFMDFVGSEEGILLAARDFFRLPARADLPPDSLPQALRRAREELRAEPMDWELLRQRGAEWMRHWDEHVRGRG